MLIGADVSHTQNNQTQFANQNQTIEESKNGEVSTQDFLAGLGISNAGMSRANHSGRQMSV